ncbi:hypothetical protein BQ8482_430022 [Mesorhizobium delmotii]|uniref:Uncharacterized protein n=1 Tax=Mesorhizobium delmotii TaxID=1631247 RepID=A0A2P9ATD4_9HYPH|nr:hypothetical protein BQ8482_430022 [Mesorhizobium delmotii]
MRTEPDHFSYHGAPFPVMEWELRLLSAKGLLVSIAAMSGFREQTDLTL